MANDNDPCRARHRRFPRRRLRAPRAVSPATAAALAERLERVLRCEYDAGVPPDKRPRAPKGEAPLGFSGERRGAKTLQLINVWKCDRRFARLARSPALGRIVAELAGWASGARLAQDQVWAKPPGAPPLVFHRDSPYFDFVPDDVVTVWVALDAMAPELGARVRARQPLGRRPLRQRGAILRQRPLRAGALGGRARGRRRVGRGASSRWRAARRRLQHNDGHVARSGANESASSPRRGVGITLCRQAKFKPTVGKLWCRSGRRQRRAARGLLPVGSPRQPSYLDVRISAPRSRRPGRPAAGAPRRARCRRSGALTGPATRRRRGCPGCSSRGRGRP